MQAFMESEVLPEYERLVDIDRKKAKDIAAVFINTRCSWGG